MKNLIALLSGMFVGVAVMLAFLYFNPFAGGKNLSPIAVTENEVIRLNYSAVADDALVYTNDGESKIAPHPVKVLQLWEAPIRHSSVMVTELADSRGQPAGIGIKFSSDSERTNLLDGEALVDSVWHLYLPGRGSLFVQQTENYWSYLREIVLPAHWSSGDNWRGTWHANVTSGPGALGTAMVTGGSGEFLGLSTEAVEALSAKAYSVDSGPVAMLGEIAIEMPQATEVNASLTQ
ncbi:MAG: hypothetical protein KJO82_12195 [Gammaproteobacteria bacterium]|nr:hypothetical protein [Gammaproteobacteria bacterium]